jgi:hypothetical protein
VKTMPLKDRYPNNGSSRKGLPRQVAQAAAKNRHGHGMAFPVVGATPRHRESGISPGGEQDLPIPHGVERSLTFQALGQVSVIVQHSDSGLACS